MTKARILAVDDEPNVTRMIKLNLEATGNFEVREENKGARALKVARDFRPDLVLLDVMMPDADGGDVARAIMDDQVLKNTKIVFLTAIVSRSEVKSTGGEISGRVFLPKPVKTDDLIACIYEQLTS
ncbi:MAG: response regulator [Gammaproteobacteria bacterium]